MAASLEERARVLYRHLKDEVESASYHLNPDEDFTVELIKGLLVNQDRYGYQSCPCRISVGSPEADRDIVCPCDYRNPDLEEYNQCYCGLYVSGDKASGEEQAGSIPERRSPRAPTEPQAGAEAESSSPGGGPGPPLPVWRCSVCGYLAGREGPPGVCPICGATQDKFERFM